MQFRMVTKYAVLFAGSEKHVPLNVSKKNYNVTGELYSLAP